MATEHESQDKPHGRDDAATKGQPGTEGKDAHSLPDGSGTNREGGGSDQGQEDAGASFDAG